MGVIRRRLEKQRERDDEDEDDDDDGGAATVKLDETLDNTLEMLERIATGSALDLGEVADMRRRLLSGACYLHCTHHLVSQR